MIQRAEHALASVQGHPRARMALYTFGYAHLIMIGGVVVVAAGVKQLIEQLHEPTRPATAVLLGCGIAIYLAGDVLFRRFIAVPSSRLRLSLVAISLATIPVGLWAGGAGPGRHAAGNARPRARLGTQKC